MPAISANSNYAAPMPHAAPAAPAPSAPHPSGHMQGFAPAYIPPPAAPAPAPHPAHMQGFAPVQHSAAPTHSQDWLNGFAHGIVHVALAAHAAATGHAPARATSPMSPEEQQALRNLWSGPDRAFMAPTDPIASVNAASHAQQIVNDLQTRGMFNQDFTDLKNAGLLPAGATQPPLSFPSRGMGKQGGLSFETHDHVYVSPATAQAAASLVSPGHAWGQETLIHELAHSLQLPSVLRSVPLREGGAQAFADAVAPQVIGPIPTRDTNYSGYVQGVRQLGAPWFMHGQFR